RPTSDTREPASVPCDTCCEDCCCTVEKPAQRSDRTQPCLPLGSCRCCLEQVTKQPDRGPRLPTPQAGVPLPVLEPPGPDFAHSLPAAVRAIVFSPQLHLLHCVWLC